MSWKPARALGARKPMNARPVHLSTTPTDMWLAQVATQAQTYSNPDRLIIHSKPTCSYRERSQPGAQPEKYARGCSDLLAYISVLRGGRWRAPKALAMRLGGLGERRKLPSGVWGGAPASKAFGGI